LITIHLHSRLQILPIRKTWFECPEAIQLFKELVFEKYVDATFEVKSDRNFWPLSFVDLKISSSNGNEDKIVSSMTVIVIIL
jgi:hypothetical protein